MLEAIRIMRNRLDSAFGSDTKKSREMDYAVNHSSSENNAIHIEEGSLPLVSVLVPFYRVEEYIERCARSVFEQTYPRLEFIFVNDASDDASMEILERAISEYPNRKETINIIQHNKNRGLAAARNTAVAACRGDFVFHVDSDDWVEPNAVEVMMEKQFETDADIVSSEAYDWEKGVKKEYLTGGWNLSKERLIKEILSFRVSTTIWRRLIRRSLYVEHNITCDERYSKGEDLQVFPRLVYYAKKVAGVNQHLYNYNRQNSLSYTNTAKQDVDVQKQGLESVKVIKAFFSDKEHYLQDAVAKIDVRSIRSQLLINALNQNQAGYDFFLNSLKDAGASYWFLLHCALFPVRYMGSNNCTLSLVRSVSKLRRKLTKI